MENKKTRKISFNFFDIIIVIIIIALAAGVCLIKMKASDTGSSVGSSGTVEYTIELNELESDPSDIIHEGDELIDKIKKNTMGTVKSFKVKHMEKYGNDADGNTVLSEVPDLYAADIVLEAECTESDSDITTTGGYKVKVGQSVNILGPGYTGTGYVIDIARADS